MFAAITQSPPDAAADPCVETDDEAKIRYLIQLKRMGELAMQMGERAAEQHAEVAPGSPEGANASLEFTRAMSTLRQAIIAEQRVRAGLVRSREPRPYLRHDPRRAQLREPLYKAAGSEPDRAARSELRRQIDEQIEDHLNRDPDSKKTLASALVAISKVFGFPVDLSQVSDEFLGMPPRRYRPDPPPPD